MKQSKDRQRATRLWNQGIALAMRAIADMEQTIRELEERGITPIGTEGSK